MFLKVCTIFYEFAQLCVATCCLRFRLCCVRVCPSTVRESQYLALKDNHRLNVILGILFSSHTPPRMYSRCYFCNKISIFSSYFHLVQVCKLQNTLLSDPGFHFDDIQRQRSVGGHHIVLIIISSRCLLC